MGSWGNTDDAANSVFYAPAQFNKTANTDNQTLLFDNVTEGDFVANLTVGQFGVTPDETQAARAGANTKMAHAGWNLRIEGTGGRAGRVQYETLVAMSSISNDGDAALVPNYLLSITTQPAADSANSSANETATFSVVGASTPTGATLGYLWEYSVDAGDTWATTAAVAGFSGQTTDTLTVAANTIADATLVRVQVSATGAANVVSDAAELTVTS